MGEDSNKKAVKAGAGYVIGNYMLKGITFLSVPIFSRLLLPEEYGIFSTYMSYESIFAIIVGLALHSSVNSAKYKYQDKLNEYVSSLVTIIMLSACFWLLFANLLWKMNPNFLDLNRFTANVLVLHCMGSAMLQMYNIYIGLSYSYKSFLRISFLNALSNIILSIILIMFVTQDNKYQGRILGTAIPLIIISLYIIGFFLKKARPRITKEYLIFGLSYSLPIIPHGISQVILASFDRIMIKNMCGDEQTGIYSFAYTINQIFIVLSSSLQNVWKPWMFERMNEKDYQEIRKKSTLYVLGIAYAAALVLMVSPEIIKILGARAYWDSTDCVVPVVMGGFFSFLYTLPSLVEYFYGKTKYIALGSMSAALINIILNFLFIPRFGYIAAAYTTLATYFLYFIFHFCVAKKIHRSTLFDEKKIFGISFALILIGMFVIVTQKLWLLRWGLEIVLIVIAMFWLQKNFEIGSKVLKKISKK